MSRKESNHTFYQSTYDIYIGNLPKNINEVDLRNLFIRYGEIKQVLCRWKEDYFGFGIVKFIHKNDAERVLRESSEVSLNGHTMPVKAARRSEQGHSGNIPIENKLNSYPDMSKNQMYNGLHFSNTDYGYFQQPKYAEEPLSQPMLLEVLCTSVENAVTFYGCPVSRSEELSLITSAVNSINLNFNRYERRPIAKRVYAALYSVDNSWYRCQIISSTLPKKPGMCSVRYIDFGNEEEMHYRNIVELPESLQNVPPFASRFVLSNLVCDTKSSAKKTYLHQLVNKRMSLCAFLSPSNCEYQVIKCSCNGKDVFLETINKGFAKPQRTSPPKIDAHHSELPPKPKAYAHGSDIVLLKNNGAGVNHNHNSIPKAQESQSSNNVSYSIKSRPKNEDSYPKKEISCNGIADDSKKDSEFHPKIIIKRGSELSEIVGPVHSANKAKEGLKLQHSYTNVIDNVISNLKLINDIRGLVSKSSDDSIISSAVNLFKEELSTMEGVENSIKSVADAHDEYYGHLEKIKTSTDKTQLPDLKSKRDAARIYLCEKLKDYLASCDNSIFERKDKIQKTIIDLESNSNAWMNVRLEKASSCIEELITEYNKVKDKRWNLVSKTRETTNQKHKNFMQMFDVLQKELYLNVSEENVSHIESSVSCVGKTSYSEKWDEALKELAKSLEEEIHMLTVNKDSSGVSVIQCLLDVLDVHKEKIDCICEVYENRFALYNELTKVPDVEAISSELKTVIKDIADLISHIGQLEDSVKENKGDDLNSEFPSSIKQLHVLILREDYLKETLCNAAVSFFPELLFECPELKLSNYSKNKFLLKNWKREYFLVTGEGTRGQTSYASKLLDDTIDIKEYKFGSTEEVNAFVQKVVTWNMAKSESLVKIKALFVKEEEKTVCVILPPVVNTLLDNSPSASEGEKACRILRQVLVGLRDIHSQGIIHRTVHPSTVLIENEKALLDFCFDLNYLDEKMNLKGLNFQLPENKAMHESADMYGYGCILLWVLFPNLSFTITENGVPNIAAFRSIVEEMMLPKDYSLLSALLDPKPEKRPSAAILLKKGFLTKYEAYCRSKGDSQKKI